MSNRQLALESRLLNCMPATHAVPATHAYLLHEFLSPISNQMSDAYGGSLENQMHFKYYLQLQFYQHGLLKMDSPNKSCKPILVALPHIGTLLIMSSKTISNKIVRSNFLLLFMNNVSKIKKLESGVGGYNANSL
jgi:hypothetical protein